MALTEESSTTSPVQAVFYNMTGQDVEMQLNPSQPETINAIPSSSPYTPNHNAETYTRVGKEHRAHEFGNDNKLSYHATSESFEVNATIKVDTEHYEVTQPILIFLFHNTVVAICPIDSIAYIMDEQEVVDMDPQKGKQLGE